MQVLSVPGVSVRNHGYVSGMEETKHVRNILWLSTLILTHHLSPSLGEIFWKGAYEMPRKCLNSRVDAGECSH